MDTGKSVRETDMIVGGDGLAYYSYETCGGSQDAWTSSLIDSTVKGKTLTVGVPKSFYPDQFMVDETGSALPDGPYIPGTEISGLWVDYLEAMSTMGEFSLQYIPVSNASMNDHGSLWTACVQDVADGLLDLCVGNFWVKPDRIGLGANFITPATTDNFKLLTDNRIEKITLSERLWTPFAPFSVGLWCSIGGTWILVGLLYTMLGNSNEFGAKDPEEALREAMEKKAKHDRKEAEGYHHHILDMHWLNWRELHKFTRLFYFALMEHANATVVYEGSDGLRKKLSLRIIKVGYALFVIVSTSCYVGNMAAMRTADVRDAKIKSVGDCEESTTCKMCIHQVSQSFFNDKYPSLDYHVSGSSKSLLTDLLDGKCTVSMSQGLHFGALPEDVEETALCDFTYDYDVYNMYVSQPAHEKVSKALSQLSVQVKDSGLYEELYDKYFTSHSKLCAKDQVSEGTSDPLDEAFTFFDFLGLYTVVWVTFLAAIITDFFHHKHVKFNFEERVRSIRDPNARKRSSIWDPFGSVHKVKDDGGLEVELEERSIYDRQPDEIEQGERQRILENQMAQALEMLTALTNSEPHGKK
ncbi:hypothetical protein TL16_g08317 [Triparma laevis f. inornata]|uniref:Ionotropic glutamate receptor C-terminal domain-containing protein n=1 Tax=Triparma laevis f. inornata TaxID=1714386 RepID=A0A9W7EG64_9STRA|nr:hypothetical protein TL16_g08317 [Triparma laevis f. inornata]